MLYRSVKCNCRQLIRKYRQPFLLKPLVNTFKWNQNFHWEHFKAKPSSDAIYYAINSQTNSSSKVLKGKHPYTIPVALRKRHIFLQQQTKASETKITFSVWILSYHLHSLLSDFTIHQRSSVAWASAQYLIKGESSFGVLFFSIDFHS